MQKHNKKRSRSVKIAKKCKKCEEVLKALWNNKEELWEAWEHPKQKPPHVSELRKKKTTPLKERETQNLFMTKQKKTSWEKVKKG
jgi:hypothetical protein